MTKIVLFRFSFALLLFAGWACGADDDALPPSAPLPVPPAETVDALRIDPSATQLSGADAACVSTLFMQRGNPSPATRSSFAAKRAEETFPVCGAGGDTLAFAVNFVGGGFVVVSATKTYAPILAFSDKGRLSADGMRGNGIAYWTACMTADIAASKAAYAADSPACAEVRSQWRDYERPQPVAAVSITSGTAYDWYMQIRARLMGEIGHCTVLDRNEFYRQRYFYGGGYSSLEETSLQEKERVLAIRYAGQPSVPPAFIWGEGVVGSGWSSETKIMPLLRTYWHQDEPYNNEIELTSSGDKHKPAGCVTIAVVQILNYYCYPAVLNGTQIDWTQTQVKYPEFALTNTEIPKLVKVVNVGVKTVNGDKESSSNIDNARAFLQKNGYSVQKYSSGLESTIIGEIKAGRPVYIKGREPGKNSGHAWVCDGYYSNDQTRKIYSYELMDTYPGTFSSDPYQSVFSSTRTVNLGRFFHMNWGTDWGADDSEPARLTYNSIGWYRSLSEVRESADQQILKIIPNN